jgi:hypothetical protein
LSDFIWILAIFFKTPVEFVQLLLSDGNLGISSGLQDRLFQSSTAKANLSAVESFCSSGIVSLIMSIRDQSTVQPAIMYRRKASQSGRALSYFRFYRSRHRFDWEMRFYTERILLTAQVCSVRCWISVEMAFLMESSDGQQLMKTLFEVTESECRL